MKPASRCEMARKPRSFIAGAAHHVVQRGNNRSVIFRSTQDYTLFLALLGDASVLFRLQIHAYVLMTNHFHLLATPLGPESIGTTMQALGRRYVPYFNGKYERTGGLFEGRYRSSVVTTESYFMTCMRYIELNPVRAGVSTGADLYRWSSYRSHALGMPDSLLTEHELYVRLGEHAHDRCRQWRGLCAEHVPDADLERLRRDLKGIGPNRNLESPHEGGLTRR